MPRPFSTAEAKVIRERLLTAGRAAVSTVGLRRTTVGRLTRAAGISQGAFYLFFESKEALLVDLLHEVEGEVRRALDDVARSGSLRDVVSAIFEAIPANPLLQSLGDADEFAWLTRVLGPKFMDEARASDDAYFLSVGRRLRRRGLLAPDAHPEVFSALAQVALGVAQQRASLGAERFASTVTLLVDALTLRLSRHTKVSP